MQGLSKYVFKLLSCCSNKDIFTMSKKIAKNYGFLLPTYFDSVPTDPCSLCA